MRWSELMVIYQSLDRYIMIYEEASEDEDDVGVCQDEGASEN